MWNPHDPFENSNPFTPGTVEYYARRRADEAQAQNSAQSPAPLGWGGAVVGIGLLLFGMFGSWDAAKAAGHVVVVAGVVLLGLGIAVVGYRLLFGPLVKLTGWAWGSHALVRSIMVGAVLGVGFGAWLGYSKHELIRGIVRLGLMGAALGLIIGMILLVVARASRRTAG